jgi:hypothetical protein
LLDTGINYTHSEFATGAGHRWRTASLTQISRSRPHMHHG